MDDHTLQQLLIRWQHWSRTECDSLGYKSLSIEHTLMTEGMVIKATGQSHIDDVQCEQLDQAIALMPTAMKRVIKLKYLFRWLNKDAAKKCDMSLSAYKEYTIASRAWLCGKLS